MLPNADVLYACDHTWWKEHIAEVKAKFKGELWTLSSTAKARHGIHLVKSERGEGLSTDKIFTGGNSGYQALSLAVLWGATRIILLGYDMQRTKGKSHWHGDHPGILGNADNFVKWRTRFTALAPELKGRGVEVINCTRQTALHCFTRQSLSDALA